MENTTQSIYDLIAYLVGMGFETEDCQLAVQNGLFTVDEAVEWLLTKKDDKPATTSIIAPTPVLKLNLALNDTTSPTNPKSCPTHQPPPHLPSTMVPMETTDHSVTSRLQDEERLRKQKFEEKQREDAKKEARLEKMKKKMAHEQALKEIKADREKCDLIKPNISSRPTPEGTNAIGHVPVNQMTQTANQTSLVQTPPNKVFIATPGTSADENKSCKIQLRLLDGRKVHLQMAPDSTLKDVWRKIETDYHLNRDGLCLVQPFPHKEFTSSQDNETLRNLELIPNGNLVLKKITISLTEQERQPPEGQSNESAPPTFPQQPITSHVPSHSHNWGTGHVLEDSTNTGTKKKDDDDDDQAREDGVGVDNDDHENHGNNHDDDDDDDDDVVIPDNDNDIHQFPELPHINHDDDDDGDDNNNDGDNDDDDDDVHPFNQHVFPGIRPPVRPPPAVIQHIWGQGQSMAIEMFGRPVLNHLDKDPKLLAAEAARNRHDQPQQPPPPSSSSIDPHHPHHHPPHHHQQQQLSSVKTNPKSPSPSSQSSLRNLQSLKTIVISYIAKALSRTMYALPTNLSGLPYDLAQNLLSDLIRQGLLTAKLMNLFVPCHLQKVDFNCYAYCTNELVASLRHHVYLKSISLSSCAIFNYKGLHSIAGLKYLTHLNLSNCYQLSDSIVPTLISLISLEKLILENTSISDVGVVNYCQSKPPSLFLLVLSGSPITNACLSSLKDIPKLRKLNLERCQITSTQGINEIPNLVSLNLNGTKISAETLVPLSTMTQLRVLNLSETLDVSSNKALVILSNLKLTEFGLPNRLTLSDRGVPYISKMPLVHLDLTNFIYITDESMSHIALITTLKSLLLRNVKVTDRGLLHLKALILLEELHLDRTELTDVGASIFKFFTKLRQLSLSITGVTDAFITAGSLDACLQLTKLNLSKTSITSSGVNRLKLPNLNLLNIDETYVKPDLITELPGCPLLNRVIYKHLKMNADDEDAGVAAHDLN